MDKRDNLITFDKLTKEEHRKIAVSGGKRSGEVRKERKTLKEELLLLLSKKGLQQSITVALLKKAKEGDIKAFEVVRDTIGEKQVEKTISDISINNYKELSKEELQKLAGE